MLNSIPRPTRSGYVWEGWYFSPESGANELTGNEHFYQNTTIYARWTKQTVITNVVVNEVTTPKDGETPVFYASVDKDSLCKIDYDYSYEDFHRGVKWYDESAKRMMSSTDTFKIGNRYTVYCALMAFHGYRFQGTPAVTINGITGKFTPNSVDIYADVYCTFTCEKSELPKKTVGDVDDDKAVTIIDATRIQRFVAELCNITGDTYTGAKLTAVEIKVADADGDGSVTILDATAVQRHIADLPTNENIGKLIK